MGKLNRKVAIISGAAGGQGFEAVRLFAQEGAVAIATDILNEVHDLPKTLEVEPRTI